MKDLIFYIVDVFTEEKYSGNQLAVVVLREELSVEDMQKLAREFNYSETSFVILGNTNRNEYDVRIFTPEKEVSFAGHPILGTAYILRNKLCDKSDTKILLNLKAGQIPVFFEKSANSKNVLWMKQINPSFGTILKNSKIVPALGIKKEDLNDKFPVEEVSTGLPFIIVPLKSIEAVRNVKVKKERFLRLIENLEAKAVLVFSSETYKQENDLNVRVFTDYYGVPEDPATGSANGCLAAYLVKNSYFNSNKINIKVEQGYEIGRPSLIHIRAEKKNDNIEVWVGGSVMEIAEGKLL